MHPETLLVSASRPAREVDAPVNDPVHFTSTFVGWEPDAAGPRRLYGRMSNPTWDGPEQLLAALEGVEDPAGRPALLFSSGMAAISAALHLAPNGGRIVAPQHAYQGGLSLLDSLQQTGRLAVERVDVTDTEAVTAAVAGASILWLESPTNPMLEVADLAALTEAAHAAGALVVVDNTFATPLVQRPLELGADVVVHSVTKYLAGHSDVVLGAAVTDDAGLHRQLHAHRTLHGAIAGPMEAFLALRGMRTLALRLERSQANAAELARRLDAARREGTLPVAAVTYPGLPDHPQHALAAAQMQGGFGSVLTVVMEGAAAADAVVQNLRHWVPATSLGGVESLVERRRRFDGEPATVPAGLLRLSVGIEHVDDLWEDLQAGMGATAVG
ncbi:PLP-dependent aspartate aminotransferase family protein [Citricoccus sp. K5]|uniref:trans-sulfuration enzyme family protein n=1 Tax=Citricoccus sp. K5 TaxID=2653135 RepID=UPI0012F00845|nr:PLP-dependent transferase [Citricoccus sp. K5]VXA91206.1 Cystathionine gamma-synthase [Citricoccus sp. K5]